MPDAASLAAPNRESEQVNRRFAGVGAAVGLIVWYNLFQIPGVAGMLISRSHPRLGAFLGFLGMLLVVPGAIWVARSVWGSGWRKAFPMAKVGLPVLVWTILCALAFLLVELAWIGAVARMVRLPHLESPLPRVGFLGILLGAPIAEEVLFRGYGLARIRELGGEGRALLFTAIVFALTHIHWVKLPGTFALGLFLGWLVLRTGSLWPAFLGHFTVNACAVMLSHFLPGENPDPDFSWALILAVGATGLACLGLLWSPQARGRIRELAAST